MKLVYLVHQFFPEFQTGTENIILNIARMSQILGNKVKVIAYSFYEDSFYDHEDNGILSKEFIYQGVPVLVFKYIDQPVDLNLELENPELYQFARKVLREETPDIIHGGHIMRVHEFVRAASVMKIPYIMTLTDFFLICPKVILAPNSHTLCSGPHKGTECSSLCKEFQDGFIKNRIYTAEKLLTNAKALVAPTYFVSNIFKQEYESITIQVVNHGVRYEHLKENNKLYQDKSNLVFGYAGTLIQHKGIHTLLQAFSNIENENVRLVVYGSGQNEFVDKLKEIAGNDHRVFFYGKYQADQLGEILSNIDVLITPSLCYETYSLVLHEALASNVPVIASNLGGMAEAITDGFTGFTIKPGETESLEGKLRLINENPQILNDIKRNISNRIVVPTVEQEAYQYYKIYNNIYQEIK